MKRLRLLEPAVGLYAFSCFLISPLAQQFIYRRLWEDITNTTYSELDNVTRCDSPPSSNSTSVQEEVQRRASLLSLYSDLFSGIPSFVVTILLVSYSDRGGRKITFIFPVIGALLYISGFLAISYFKLNIYLMIGCSVVSSFFGSFGTFLGGCFSYVADISENDYQRILRLAGVDMILGVLGGVAALSTGYFLKAAGFNWPFITSASGLILLLLYVILVLEETVKKIPPDASRLESPQGFAIKQMFYNIYHVFAGGDGRQTMTLVILLVTFTVFAFSDMGVLSLITLYELNKPLCWTGIMIGYGSALGTVVFVTSFFGVLAFSKFKTPQTLIVLIGFVSFAVGMVMVSFAKTTIMMFIARIPMLLCSMPFSVLRSMMSKIISKTEQGALFACVSCLESITATVSGIAFNSIYAATVTWYSGFVFLLSAGLCIIPSILIGVLIVMKVDFSYEDTKTADDNQGLIYEVTDNIEEVN